MSLSTIRSAPKFCSISATRASSSPPSQWACGDQAGLRFTDPFDIACLAKARPDVTPHSWNVPGFLTDAAMTTDSPWHENWSRSSIAEIRSDLEGYLKR